MVDIETYDIKPTAGILSIGATVIEDTAHTFYTELDKDTQWERTMSIQTVDWWMKQGNPPICGTTPLHKALTSLSDWIKSFDKEPVIWCKGTDFDVAILTHAYNQLYLPVPWKYNNVRDCRTVFKIAGWEPKKAAHNALQDAIEQADDLLGALNSLNGKLA